MHLKKYSNSILRISLAFVMLWFGINQILNPDYFIGYLPEWLMGHSVESMHHHMMLMHTIIPDNAYTLLFLNGIFEIIFGSLLLLGIFTRFSSLVLMLHILSIAFNLGYNDTAIRDLGLVAGYIVVFLNGTDIFCLDNKLKKQKLLKYFYLFDKYIK